MRTLLATRDLEAAVPAAPAAPAVATAKAMAAEDKTTAAAAAAQQEKALAAAAAAKKVVEEEDPRLCWAFVRKVYAILSLQFALKAAIAATACLVHPIPRFFISGPPAAVSPMFIAILVSPLIVMFPMLKYREKNPTNLVLLGLFTLCCSLSIAVSASTTLGSPLSWMLRIEGVLPTIFCQFLVKPEQELQ